MQTVMNTHSQSTHTSILGEGEGGKGGQGEGGEGRVRELGEGALHVLSHEFLCDTTGFSISGKEEALPL